MVDGADAQQDRTLGSLRPLLSWGQPMVGLAHAYEVRIFRLYTPASEPDVVRAETVATFLTAQPQLSVPPGVLQPKQSYVVRIGAMWTPGVDLTQRPYQLDSLVDTALAESLTSVLSTP
jgi:hypothetical protein